MKPGVCVCCGELMSKRGGALSRNPNICASCSSLADGLEDSNEGIIRENRDRSPTDAASEAAQRDLPAGFVGIQAGQRVR